MTRRANPDARASAITESACSVEGDITGPAQALTLWYRQPAAEWVEALPIGNGALGAMVYGGVNREWLQLNEESLWTGRPIVRDREGAFDALGEARRLLFAGKYAEAEALIEERFMGRRIERGSHTYQTLGDLELCFPERTAVSEYRRELDLDRAVAAVRYSDGEAVHTREAFASAPDHVLVLRLSCDHPGGVTFDASLTRCPSAAVTPVGDNGVLITGQAHAIEELQDEGDGSAREGVCYASGIRVVAHGGSVRCEGNCVRVVGADSAEILLAAATDFQGQDPASTCADRLRTASARPFADLLARHVEDYQRLFRRVSFELGTPAPAALPTDELLARAEEGECTSALLSLYFQFGRYLLISSSRPGGLPANLQGIWADGFDPPRNADYHTNINLQMNYWPAEVCALTECHEPLFTFVDALRPRGRETARDVFDCRGFVVGHTTDVWLHGSIIGKPAYGMWPYGAAWCACHFWEHFSFGGDRDFLETLGYPVMREAAEFLLDFLVEHPATGQLVSGPSTSPENRFRTADGQVAHLTMGPTMDHQIIRDLFGHCIKASQLLGTDSSFRAELEEALERLAPPRIGSDGRLMEWPEEFEEPEPGHRHISHLYGLHPGAQITPERTPHLVEAAQRTLDYRLANGGGHTGWSRAWIVNIFARLHDGERALENLQALLAQSTLPNLFDNHPPFQIDGNFGGSAGMVEMLLQSHELLSGQSPEPRYLVRLLPALPGAWSEGRVTGLRARGGLEVSMDWNEGRLEKATFSSAKYMDVSVQYRGVRRELTVEPGIPMVASGDDFR